MKGPNRGVTKMVTPTQNQKCVPDEDKTTIEFKIGQNSTVTKMVTVAGPPQDLHRTSTGPPNKKALYDRTCHQELI